MLPVAVTVGPLATADADGICASQSAAGAGALTINGALATSGVATMDVARRVLITSAGDDRTITFRITGTNAFGNPIRETVTGTNATTAYTVQDFKTVTQVYVSGATAAAVEIGTNGVASGPWVVPTVQLSPVNIAIGCVVSGTVNYGIEYTFDSVQAPNGMGSQALGNYPPTPTVWDHASLVNLAVNTPGSITTPVSAWRPKVNSGTGSVTATGIQAGVRGA